MLLNAISLGYAVPQADFEALVHSSFRSAANLRMDGDQFLLTLLLPSETDLPQGIRVDSPPGFTFEDLPINEHLVCHAGLLRCERFPLAVDLLTGVVWKSDLVSISRIISDPLYSAAWAKVWKLLNAQQTLIGAEIVADVLLKPDNIPASGLIHRLARGVTALITSTQNYEFNTTEAVSALVGLGSGLTPGGDDLLVGYMAGLLCRTGRNKARNEFISHLGKTILDRSKHTTDISRTFLYHATNGQFSRNLTSLAEAICNGVDSDQLEEFATAAMQMGHTSGVDSVTGLLLGLKAWE